MDLSSNLREANFSEYCQNFPMVRLRSKNLGTSLQQSKRIGDGERWDIFSLDMLSVSRKGGLSDELSLSLCSPWMDHQVPFCFGIPEIGFSNGELLL